MPDHSAVPPAPQPRAPSHHGRRVVCAKSVERWAIPSIDQPRVKRIWAGMRVGSALPPVDGHSCCFGMVGICSKELECVYTRGPYVADAPGTCQPICGTSRDNWGNCVEEGCNTWFDSCNTCIVNEDYELTCTEEICYHGISSAICIDGKGTITPDPIIPKNCVTWYDGCNTCSVSNGILQGCTLMMCISYLLLLCL